MSLVLSRSLDRYFEPIERRILNGFDKDGRPIIYMRPGRENTQQSPRQLRHLVWCLYVLMLSGCSEANSDNTSTESGLRISNQQVSNPCQSSLTTSRLLCEQTPRSVWLGKSYIFFKHIILKHSGVVLS